MKLVTRRQALLGLTAAGAAVLGGCAVNPVTGKRQLMLMTESQEIELGKQSHPEILASYGVYPDSTLQAWFNTKGQEMVRVSQRSNLPFTFTVLDSPVVNAFAVPGGYIYVTRGIMGYFNDEAQFAGVLGHELGHVAARHSAQQYSKSQVTSLAIGVGTVFSEEFALFSDLVSAGTSLMFLKFSRDDERQADQLGVEYSSKVGYDAVRMGDFFSTLERMRPAGGSLPEWASTHPDPGDRINATHTMARSWQKAHPGTYVTRRNEYLERVNGLVFGDDPRQGYVKNGVFYHPGLKFQFPVPAAWTLTNQPSEVRAAPKEGENAILIFRVEKGKNPQEAGRNFASSNKITLTDSKAVTVNGMSGYATLGQMDSDGQTLTVRSQYVQMDSTVFAFHGLSSPGEYRTHEPAFSQTAAGFKRLSDKALLTVAPRKVEVRTVQKARTLKAAFQDLHVTEDKLNEFAILNGMNLDDKLSAGARIKVIG